MTAPSRIRRTFAPRVTLPSVTMQPAMTPILRGAEDLAHLDVADDVLDGLRRQHALHGVAQLVDRAVDDRVGADLDALAVGELARRRPPGAR